MCGISCCGAMHPGYGSQRTEGNAEGVTGRCPCGLLASCHGTRCNILPSCPTSEEIAETFHTLNELGIVPLQLTDWIDPEASYMNGYEYISCPVTMDVRPSSTRELAAKIKELYKDASALGRTVKVRATHE